MSAKKPIPEGKRFKRLTVISESPPYVSPNGVRLAMSKCVCDCGTITVVTNCNLRFGKVNSCGCYRKEVDHNRFKTHGWSNTPTWYSWTGMKARCLRRKHMSFANYGGRGIRVCRRWMKFANFLKDMGKKPPGMTLERKDGNGDYTPKNCIWATYTAQARNTRANVVLTVNGKTGCLAELAEFFGIKASTARDRMVSGWTAVKAFTTPVRGIYCQS